jgi:ABC-type uncharacterized transport system substrate-binding protein
MHKSASALLAILLALVPALGAHAHPHVFISSRIALEFVGPSLARISVEWTFDELFSQTIAVDYDRGKKGAFTDAEAAALRKGAFDNLKNYHYFLALALNGKPLALPPIRDFMPSLRGGRLVYAFSLPVAIPVAAATAAATELLITVYDDTYYVAFDKMSPAEVAVRGSDSVEAAVAIEKTRVKAEWPGQFMPDQIVLRMKRK